MENAIFAVNRGATEWIGPGSCADCQIGQGVGPRGALCLLVAFLAGWLTAQLVKLIVGVLKNKGKMSFKDVQYYLFKSGGMPSGHTASFIALDTAMGLVYGFNTPVFILALCTTAIFVYDAVNVRYAVGEHGKLLNEIAVSDKNPKTKPQKIIEGHTVPQVIVGGILGIILGIIVFLAFGGSFPI